MFTSSVFLNHSPSFFLRQCLSLNKDLASSAGLADQWVQEVRRSSPPMCGGYKCALLLQCSMCALHMAPQACITSIFLTESSPLRPWFSVSIQFNFKCSQEKKCLCFNSVWTFPWPSPWSLVLIGLNRKPDKIKDINHSEQVVLHDFF